MASDEPPAGPSEPHLGPHEIEQLDKVLTEFKRSLELPQGDPGHALAEQNMRLAGFSVPQIMVLSGDHNLAESTIKAHLRGIAAPTGAPAQKAIQFLTKALDENVTVQTIHDSLEVKAITDANNVKIKDIIDLVRALNTQKIPLNDFIEDYKQMKGLELTPLNLKSLLNYRDRLNKKGFGLNQLELLIDACEKYGGSEKVLKAISIYKALEDLQGLIKTTTEEQKKLSEQLRRDRKEKATLEQERKEVREQIEAAKTTLARLKRLSDLGYNDVILRDLAASSSTLGGVQKTVSALRKLHNVNELDLKISELKRTKAQLEQEKTRMETTNAHLKAHIDATTKLIQEHGLGLDAITALLRIAEKYGNAPTVLKAFETYASLQELNKEKKKADEDLKKTKSSLDDESAKEKELRNKIATLLPEIEKSVKDWIKGLDEKLGEATKSVTSTLDSQNDTFKKNFNDSLTDVKALKATLENDFKTIKDNANNEVKTLTDQMRTNVDNNSKDFTKTFDETKQKILKEIESILDAAHELDKAYEERQTELPQLKAYLQLIDLVNDPRKVEDIRFLATVRLTLQKTAEWITLNPSRFSVTYPTPGIIKNSIGSLNDLLSKVKLEPPPTT